MWVCGTNLLLERVSDEGRGGVGKLREQEPSNWARSAEQEDKLYPGRHLEKPSLRQCFWRMTFPTLNFQCWPWLQAGLFSSLSQQQERSADEAFFRLQLCTAEGELWLKGFYNALQLHSLEGIQFWTPSRIFKWEIIYFIEKKIRVRWRAGETSNWMKA